MNNKRTILWIALIAMVIVPVSAQSVAPESDFWVRPLGNGSGVEIVRYVGAQWEVVIPSRIHNQPVTSIGVGAFRNCVITGVIIPSSVTNIGVGAFWDCSDLINVVIPDGVTSIGDQAFSGCSGLARVVIPKSVTSIGNYAFGGCSLLIIVIFEGPIASENFNNDSRFPSFPGDLRAKFYANNEANGTAGFYTRPSGAWTLWTRHLNYEADTAF